MRLKLKSRLLGFLALVVLLSATLTAGCDSGGSYTIIRGGINTNGTSMEGSYGKFSGNYFHNLNLEKGDTVIFNLEVTTKKGSLNARLDKEDGETIFNIENDTVVNIKKSGTYKVLAIGDSHKGDFFLTWQVN